MNRLSFSILLFILVLSSSFQIKNINHQVPIQTSSEYAQYIQALNGLATQMDIKTNPKLAEIIENERISLLNPAQDIILAFVDEIKQNNQNLPAIEDLKVLTELDNFLGGFDIVSLAEFDAQTLSQKLTELQKAGKTVHTLEVSQELMQHFQTHSQRKLEQLDSDQNSEEEESSESVFEGPENSVHKKILVKAVKTEKSNPTYILKFFFAFMFIIVSLGSLMTIANMQNKKDTLLYAKFIADVGTR